MTQLPVETVFIYSKAVVKTFVVCITLKVYRTSDKLYRDEKATNQLGTQGTSPVLENLLALFSQ